MSKLNRDIKPDCIAFDRDRASLGGVRQASSASLVARTGAVTRCHPKASSRGWWGLRANVSGLIPNQRRLDGSLRVGSLLTVGRVWMCTVMQVHAAEVNVQAFSYSTSDGPMQTRLEAPAEAK